MLGKTLILVDSESQIHGKRSGSRRHIHHLLTAGYHLAVPGEHRNANQIARLPGIFDPVNDAIALTFLDIDDSLHCVAMSEIFPLCVRATAEFMFPETKRFLIRTYPRVHHVNWKARVLELSIDVFFTYKNRRFLSALQFVLGECDQFHRQFFMIFGLQCSHYLTFPIITSTACRALHSLTITKTTITLLSPARRARVRNKRTILGALCSEKLPRPFRWERVRVRAVYCLAFSANVQ